MYAIRGIGSIAAARGRLRSVAPSESDRRYGWAGLGWAGVSHLVRVAFLQGTGPAPVLHAWLLGYAGSVSASALSVTLSGDPMDGTKDTGYRERWGQLAEAAVTGRLDSVCCGSVAVY